MYEQSSQIIFMLKLRKDTKRGSAKRKFIIDKINNIGCDSNGIDNYKQPLGYLFISLMKSPGIWYNHYKNKQRIAVQHSRKIELQTAIHNV